MSRKTIQALRSFTTKLAAEEGEPSLILPNMPDTQKNTPPARGVSPGPGLVPNITTPPKPFKMQAYNDYQAEKNPSLLARLYDQLSQYGQYLPSGASAGAIGGGAALGGLGAYGLAQLMRSRKDEEESSFPWLSTLAGTAGGGALAAYLMSRAGQQAPAAPAQAPAATPAALNTTPVPAGSQPTIA